MEMKSASGSELNLEALYQIMPSAFTEVRDDKTGEIAHKINFNTLRELLGDNAYEGADEEYGFKWVGKNAARREAARAINKTLRPCPEESVDWDNTQNLYIEGDNLEVLKLLQKSYLGKIKMIYIDPPYNTGNDFVYRDDFAMDKDGYDRAAGDVDELGNRFRKNADGNARFHSDWCSMIYERLLVARSLLTNDGVIFISIDEHESHNLKKICDEIFGEANYFGDLIWESTTQPANTGGAKFGLQQKTEVILLYGKNKSVILGFNLETGDSTLTYPHIGKYGKCRFEVIEKSDAGGYSRPTMKFQILGQYPREGKRWQIGEEKARELEKTGKVEIVDGIVKKAVYPEDELDKIQYKPFWSLVRENKLLTSENGTALNGKEEVNKLFECSLGFDTVKPSRLLKKLIFHTTNQDGIILDFFSGTATTAHAVMKLNSEDGGNRKFIMVQLPETADEDSEAYKAGYNNICEIGKERIRRAGKKIKEEFGSKADNFDVGFRLFKCEDSFMNDVYFSPANLKQEDLFSQISNIKDGTSDLSLLFGCMLDWGVQLSLPLSSFEVGDKTIYNVNDGDLVACFAEDINEDIITAIAEIEPLRVVFRDSCFSDAPLKMNLFELFKQKCGWSEEQVKSRVHVI